MEQSNFIFFIVKLKFIPDRNDNVQIILRQQRAYHPGHRIFRIVKQVKHYIWKHYSDQNACLCPSSYDSKEPTLAGFHLRHENSSFCIFRFIETTEIVLVLPYLYSLTAFAYFNELNNTLL